MQHFMYKNDVRFVFTASCL